MAKINKTTLYYIDPKTKEQIELWPRSSTDVTTDEAGVPLETILADVLDEGNFITSDNLIKGDVVPYTVGTTYTILYKRELLGYAKNTIKFLSPDTRAIYYPTSPITMADINPDINPTRHHRKNSVMYIHKKTVAATWISCNNRTAAGWSGACDNLVNIVHYVGGFTDQAMTSPIVNTYVINGTTWSAGNNINMARGRHCYEIMRNKNGYVIGGSNRYNKVYPTEKQINGGVYSLTAEVLESLNDGSGVKGLDSLLVFGGTTDFNTVNTFKMDGKCSTHVYKYNEIAWSRMPDMISGKFGHSSVGDVDNALIIDNKTESFNGYLFKEVQSPSVVAKYKGSGGYLHHCLSFGGISETKDKTAGVGVNSSSIYNGDSWATFTIIPQTSLTTYSGATLYDGTIYCTLGSLSTYKNPVFTDANNTTNLGIIYTDKEVEIL